jgi:hypothetical protein
LWPLASISSLSAARSGGVSYSLLSRTVFAIVSHGKDGRRDKILPEVHESCPAAG